MRSAWIGAAFGISLLLASGAAAEVFLDPTFGVQVTQDIVYGSSEVQTPAPGLVNLTLDLYEPIGATPPLLPAFLLAAHRTEDKDDADVVQFANELASRGYVVAVADTRRPNQGPVLSSEFQPLMDDLVNNSITREFVAGVEDVTKAHRWLVLNAAAHDVDVTRIVVGGNAAHGLVALGMAYVLDDHGVIDLPDIAIAVPLWGALLLTGIAESGEPPTVLVNPLDETLMFAEDTRDLLVGQGIDAELIVQGTIAGFADFLGQAEGMGPLVQALYGRLFPSSVPLAPAWSLGLLGLTILAGGSLLIARRGQPSHR